MGVGIIHTTFVAMGVVDVTLDPVSVAANTVVEQNMAVPGVKVGDIVYVTKAVAAGGLAVVNARVSSTGVVALGFANVTASPIDPISDTYRVLWFRPEGGVSAPIAV